ncbi:hypothetical protein [uncultured Erythrobacter sp.]|uniref:hypothetical protein n=1 Tax=uncultured Erythrobacter sp. TaxID=263913 RepID=UPI002612BFD7|nr:hypothetical protein [uncultured Erythrobacter sp.]
MTTFNRIIALIGALLLMSPAAASAQSGTDCDVRFTQESATITMVAPDIGRGQQAFGEQVIRLTTVDDDQNRACRADLRISRLNTAPSFPSYRIFALGRPIVPSISETVANAQNQIIVAIPRNRSGRSINLRAVAPANWGIHAGRHNEQLQLSLVGQAGEVLDKLALNLVLDVPKAVDVMFVGATGIGRANRINLGRLSAAQSTRSEPFGLRVWSSSGYRIGLSSENQGKLVHRQGMDEIPYKLQLEGREVPLESGIAPYTSPEATGRSGDIYSLGILVPARRSVAGRYQDRILVTVSAI